LPPSVPAAEEERRKARDDAAKAANVSPRLVQDAKVVVEAAKEDPALAPLVDEVREGKKSVGEAAKEVKEAKRKKAAPAAGETVQQQTKRWLEESAANARRLRKSLIELSDNEEAPNQARDLARGALRDFEDVCARLVRGLFKEAS
jgi:HSP90 family molecular chaperone